MIEQFVNDWIEYIESIDDARDERDIDAAWVAFFAQKGATNVDAVEANE